MAGVETIVEEIRKTSAEKCEQLIREAEDKAAAVINEAKAKAEEILKNADAEADRFESEYSKRVDSQAALEKRRIILEARQSVIEEIIDDSRRALEEQEDGAYFDMLLKIAERYVSGEKGEIVFGKKDLGRIPADFMEKIGKIASAKGGELCLGNEPCDIGSGFVLRYGGIDENCSLAALFAV